MVTCPVAGAFKPDPNLGELLVAEQGCLPDAELVDVFVETHRCGLSTSTGNILAVVAADTRSAPGPRWE